MPRISRLPTRLGLGLLSVIAAISSLLIATSYASADSYTVREGDTLSDIALCLDVPVSVLLTLNEAIVSANHIFVGQRIEIPANAEQTGDRCAPPAEQSATAERSPQATTIESKPELAVRGCLHIVANGETFSGIADDFSTDMRTMTALNPMVNPHLLFPGQAVVVPCSAITDQSQSAPTPALTAGITDASPPAPRFSTVDYVVRDGDGLLLIAERHGITLAELLQYNDFAEDAIIHPGDVIQIPIPDYLAPALDPDDAWGLVTSTYQVRSGDTAGQIALIYGISVPELSQLNGYANLNLIMPGQLLVVPWIGPAPDAAPGAAPAVEARRRTYRVQPGDTFQAIAQTHGLTMDELRELNPGRRSDLVVIGQSMYLPGVIAPPIVSEERTLWESDLPQYAAAALGVTPHTLLANHPWLETEQWMGAGTYWRLPKREGLLVTVKAGDTLLEIANRHGVEMSLILSDPAYGVDDPNAIVIGQEIILPLEMPDFIWPAQGELTDPFGQCRSWDCSYRHKGLDVALDFYVPIVAAADGLVTFVGGDEWFGLGWYVEIDHGGGWRTVYAHLIEFAVAEGEHVGQGEVIGYNGSTGYSTGPHLHFEVQHHDWYVDPLVVLP